MTRHRELALVLGLGRFGGGAAAVRFLCRRGARVRVGDRADAATLADSVAALSHLEVEWRLGENGTDLLDGVDTIVANPAVPDEHPILDAARAAGIAVTQEINLFLEHFPGRVVLVTGTNGKSTTTVLLGRCLRQQRIDTIVGGNIGRSLLDDEATWSAGQIAVLEVSSFQLTRVASDRHRVHGAVLTELGSDHLDRHGTVEAYHAAKAVAARVAERFLVHLARDRVASGFESPAPRRLVGAGGVIGFDDGWIVDREDPGPIVHRDALELVGAFQADNAALAAAAARALGVPRGAVGVAIATMRPLPYRLRRLGAVRGVDVYDNSVSTEVESTRSALDAIGTEVHWIGGGKSKDGRFADTAARIAPRLRSAHLFGAAASELRPELERHGVRACTVHDDLDQATAAALAAATTGEAVLFSPAFASFDQFPNFRARAESFYACLRRRGLELRETPAGPDRTPTTR